MGISKKYKSKYLIVYSILLQSEKVDYKLIEIVFWDNNNTKYVSFKKMNKDVKISLLHLNNMTNSEAKYEVLENLDVN